MLLDYRRVALCPALPSNRQDLAILVLNSRAQMTPLPQAPVTLGPQACNTVPGSALFHEQDCHTHGGAVFVYRSCQLPGAHSHVGNDSGEVRPILLLLSLAPSANGGTLPLSTCGLVALLSACPTASYLFPTYFG